MLGDRASGKPPCQRSHRRARGSRSDRGILSWLIGGVKRVRPGVARTPGPIPLAAFDRRLSAVKAEHQVAPHPGDEGGDQDGQLGLGLQLAVTEGEAGDEQGHGESNDRCPPGLLEPGPSPVIPAKAGIYPRGPGGPAVHRTG